MLLSNRHSARRYTHSVINSSSTIISESSTHSSTSYLSQKLSTTQSSPHQNNSSLGMLRTTGVLCVRNHLYWLLVPGNHCSDFNSFSRMSYKWNYIGCSLFCLASFTWHNASEKSSILLYLLVFIPFICWVALHCMNIYHTLFIYSNSWIHCYE